VPLNESYAKKIERLLMKAQTPPTFTDDELALPISLFKSDDQLATTQDYINNVRNEKKQILDIEDLNKQQLYCVVIARLDRLPANYSVGISRQKTFSKEDLLNEVKHDTKQGREIVDSEVFNIAVHQKLIAKFARTRRLESTT